MKINYRLYSIMGILLLMTGLFGCSGTGDDTPGNNSATQEERVEAVRIMELEYSEISRSITSTASMEAFREVYLAPASPGRVDRIHVEVGARISGGQLLVEMDRTQLQQARVQLENVRKDYHRLDTLRRAGSIPQQQYDQIKTQYELALSNVEFLEENTRMLAPFDATVSGKYYENGEMFSGAPNTPAGKAAILSLVQTSPLKARVNVSERFYPQIKTGMPVRIISDIWPGETFDGTVLRVYPTIDQVTRTFTIEVSIPNRDDKLRPGMFARAGLDIAQERVFAVPSLAVLKLQGSNERYVFLNENGRARRVAVQLGDRFDDMVEIISDEINTGDNLIVAGQARLLDGVAVRVR